MKLIDKDALVAEIEKLKSNLIHGACSSQVSMETRCKEEAYNEVLAIINSDKEEPVSKKFAFKAIPRLLEMIEPTDRAKAYIAKLADTLEVEGYSTDAKIVRESLKIMNGEKVPMATMDEEPVSEDLESEIQRYYVDWDEHPQYVQTARHFAKWQKKQMMAKAINVEASLTMSVTSICISLPLGVNVGDKVKVIIIKED